MGVFVQNQIPKSLTVTDHAGKQIRVRKMVDGLVDVTVLHELVAQNEESRLSEDEYAVVLVKVNPGVTFRVTGYGEKMANIVRSLRPGDTLDIHGSAMGSFQNRTGFRADEIFIRSRGPEPTAMEIE